jgi:DNA-binding NtrC family response regulator
MHSSSIVLLQGESRLAQSLIASLRGSFHSIRTVRSLADLRFAVGNQRAEAVILDMEVASLADVARLSSEFSGLRIVCTHRLADEQLWAAALSVGAADLCPSSDISAILAAVHRGGIEHPTAA